MRLFTQLGWFFRQKWHHYLGAVILLIIIALLQLVPPRLVGIIIDSVVVAGNGRRENLAFYIALIAMTSLLVYGLRCVWRILLFGAAYRLAVDLRDQLYHRLSQQLPSFYLRYRTGDLMALATNDIDRVVFAAGEGVLTLVDSLVMGCSVFIVMSLQVSWKLTLLSLIPMPIMAMLINRDGQRLNQCFRLAQAAFSDLNNQAEENLTSIRMIKSFGLEKHQSLRFSSVALEASKKNMHVAKIEARLDPTIYLAVGLSNLLAVSGGAWLVMCNAITLGQLTSFIMYIGLMIWPMLALAWMLNIVERGSAAYSRIRKILEERIDVVDGTLSLPTDGGVIKVTIEAFSYPNACNLALQDIYLTLFPGQMLGVCGPTGSGKTTLLSLILRQFEVTKGEIRFQDFPLRALTLDYWRSQIAVVTQMLFLFSDSIAKNIAFGRPEATEQQIEKAARLACIHEDILSFPDGYATEIGERGVMLSGGQKQRLAIARALLLETDILVLDDALSAVDSKTEYSILQNLRIFSAQRTVIITAHRLSALQEANEILVLKEGRIAQRGDHKALLKEFGWYRDMYCYQQLQASLEQENNHCKESE
ncbi:ABC-type multidrug transport system, ATPase and permease component [secondary endosymbiont of Heteropsylla cubana]|uniref:Multidrug resistance-like ATP-binding protein MdlA n=1 Tax=secondary endosymbiont of Heteropsylla cubana TaxID=134287 RepID=J3YTD6_9ENTR|nr:SmdA family multidrug ABC transporter permease/ATP-binding protein [secondary endosymbiont of Heteropsylla cubana]AFP85713.1 ABC-type multidrug transport system, ATPase and permease component [secondary endosymbiont of Heteropsylla cubana]